MLERKPDYTGMTLKPVTHPKPERVGSWWRRRWHFTLEEPPHSPMTLPPPLSLTGEERMVLSAWWQDERELIVEVFTGREVLSGEELTQVSVVAAWIRSRSGEKPILVEGMVDHPILKTSVLKPDVVARFEELGYLGVISAGERLVVGDDCGEAERAGGGGRPYRMARRR